ncbi:MAG: DUF308 domain-containing protein [Tannerella sp.]|jgi:hypothetical protein|nr:DUF308 domain-containing protein [Tannerella sp.]
MENKLLSIEEVFDHSDNNLVYKTKPSVLLSALLIIAGILFIVFNGQITKSPESMLPTLFIIIGILFLAWGIIYTFFSKTKYKLTQGQQNISFSEILFDIKERERLLRIIDEGNLQELEKLKPAVIDTLKLRIASTPDGSFCYTQAVTYVPYEFVIINEAHQHTQEEANILLNMQKKQNSAKK